MISLLPLFLLQVKIYRHTIHIMMFTQALLLLFIANGTPILARLLLVERCSAPINQGKASAFDGQPLLGSSKSWRGVIAVLLYP